jgi:hypothetical protein
MSGGVIGMPGDSTRVIVLSLVCMDSDSPSSMAERLGGPGAREPYLPEDLKLHVDWRYNNAVDKGWWPLLSDLDAELALIDEGYQLAQVKQKWGRLTVYWDGERDRFAPAVQRAADRASITCENCGAPGELRASSPHGVRVLCAAHLDQTLPR